MIAYAIVTVVCYLYWAKVLIKHEKLEGRELRHELVVSAWLVMWWPVMAGITVAIVIRKMLG
ncbi:MAG: hypothetical protein C0610_16745 [Desulfobacteraceae bacterium]|nr:MAG: hypothetical protein C0610_16745 [Desulfobacteraceae bacterium]